MLSTVEATRAAAALEVQDIVRTETEVYVPFAEPLQLVTPPQHVTAVDTDLRTVHVDLSESLREFVDALEKRVTDLVVENREAWFPGKKAPDEGSIRSRFKSFFQQSGDYRLKLDPAAEAFTATGEPIEPFGVEAGARARLVLEVGRICFGKREFGVSIRVKQLRLARTPVCLIEDDSDTAAEGTDDFDFL